MKIVTPITNDPVTTNPREAEMFQLVFDRDWEMSLEIDIFEKNSQGQRLFDVASQLPLGQQRDAAQAKHFPTRRPYTTKGSMVNAQGNVVEQGGVASEKEALFSITNDQLLQLTGKTGSDSALETIREFVKLKIQEISARGQN
jgi:hypothetical protein